MSTTNVIQAQLEGRNPDVSAGKREAVRIALQQDAELQGRGGTTSPAAPAPTEQLLPKLPAGYQVIRELGRGGMGTVWLAYHIKLQRQVAVKVLNADAASDPEAMQRFQQEAKLLAALRHPWLVRVYAMGTAGHLPFFTMDYIEGKSLERWIERGPVPVDQAVRTVSQAAAAVAAAHARGIVHRDLKPSNILLDLKGQAYVADFGVARNLTRPCQLTATGDLVGTPAYMAPEQVKGQKDQIGPATDVHALGLILYELLTGRRAYWGDTPVEVLKRLLTDEPIPPREVVRRVPRDVETICMKALEKSPARRYATAGRMLEDLHRYTGGEPILAKPPIWAERQWRRCRRHPWAVAACLLAALALSVGLPVWREAQGRRDVAHALDLGATLQADGKPEEALKTYEAVYDRANPAEQGRMTDRMARCTQDLTDPKAAWDAVGRVLEHTAGDPDAREKFIERESHFDVAKARCEGMKLLQEGKYAEALDAYDQDYVKANERDKEILLGCMANCAVALGTDERGCAAWRRILARAPGRSFDVFDRYAAQAFLNDLRRRYDGRLMTAAEKEPENAKAAIERIELFLKADPQPGDGREEMKGDLARLEAGLRPADPPAPPSAPAPVDATPPSPAGPEAQPVDPPVAAQPAASPKGARVLPSGDPTSDLAEAHRLEDGGDKAGALALYRAAWEEVRVVCPVASFLEHTGYQVNGAWRSEWTNRSEDFPLLNDAHEALRRLAPREADPLAGGLVLRVPTNALPKGYVPEVRLDLWGDGVDGPEKRPFRVNVRPSFRDGVARVPVADGRYRLLLSEPGASYAADAALEVGPSLRLEFAGMPGRVEVRGRWVELPLLQVRRTPQVGLLGPDPEASVDLARDSFRWAPVPHAERYVLDLEGTVRDKKAQGERTWLVRVPVETTSVCLGRVPRNGMAGDLGELLSNRRAEWSVEAYDAQGNPVGSKGRARRLRISRGLEGK